VGRTVTLHLTHAAAVEDLDRLTRAVPSDIAEALGLTPYEGGDTQGSSGKPVRVLRTRETWFGSPVVSIPTPPQDGALSR
jgi:hypothetical protein